MVHDSVLIHQRSALRAFDLFCSAGRPQRPAESAPGPELIEVSATELVDAFLKLYPSFAAYQQEVLGRLPMRVRVHAEWWSATKVSGG